ncbi:HlyC/CorC family transporter [Thiohalomonas denitrificans]|uniref:HlyC/CorC family transporter n=1 Tax=Thiohalomonas denitrificans TaxID=415747 RepID=UPI0026F1C434|nr:HlyC/CorC family transporter [Thiohalomonas denitrificans]
MLNDIPIGALLGALVFLVILSAFFSGSETGLISLNRYRLRHMAKDGHPGALRASRLLKRPDRLIGLILLGNNFVNILASALATIVAIRLVGEAGPLVATAVLTVVILLFAEVTPKTLAALHPERIAFPASFILGPLLKVFYPLVWLINIIANGLLRLLGVSTRDVDSSHLSSEELRTVVNEAGTMIPRRHQKMLLNILDLEKATVEDIMIPRNEIAGIDLEDEWTDIVDQLTNSQHTRLPVYRGGIDNVVGIVHLRDLLALQQHSELDMERFMDRIREVYFIPEATRLNTQLLNFQKQRHRMGLVVDEYGDIQGLVTLDDILEEIVGEFTTGPGTTLKEIHPQEDGTYLVDGSANVRELNRIMNWSLPTEGAKTLNGMLIEYLETIPEPGTSVLLNGYPLEVVQTGASAIKTVRVDPLYRKARHKDTE